MDPKRPRKSAAAKTKKDPEKVLRAQILQALKDSPGIEDARESHGTHEFGLDIRFQQRDLFGKPVEVGLQVKAGNISPKDVHAAIGQVVIGLGNKNPENSRRPEVIYLVTDGTISEGARIALDCAKNLIPSLKWIDGDRLSPFLKKGTTTPPPFAEEA